MKISTLPIVFFISSCDDKEDSELMKSLYLKKSGLKYFGSDAISEGWLIANNLSDEHLLACDFSSTSASLSGGTPVISIEPGSDNRRGSITLKPLTGGLTEMVMDDVTYDLGQCHGSFSSGTARK